MKMKWNDIGGGAQQTVCGRYYLSVHVTYARRTVGRRGTAMRTVVLLDRKSGVAREFSSVRAAKEAAARS